MKVFISGPYTLGGVAQNVRRAILTADAVAALGHTPFIPHLSHFWLLISPHPDEFWLAQDLEWLTVCDALLRLPGESAGADGEVAEARKLGIPVYASIAALPRDRMAQAGPTAAPGGEEG